MAKIVQLDELTINQIAAGEVIERPASVVKELVENSIDAGATIITVEVKAGGVELIKITDNGSGIEKEDMPIAFDKHATSKIRSAYDIENVLTMGFRGEALASVAAVANVEMVSKTENETGNRIVIEGGEILEFSPYASQNGTTIYVRNLFFNMPVRYKFLKKDYTELGYIEDIIRNLALINKDIAFKLINNGRVILQTAGDGNFKSVIYSIYGAEIADNIIEVEDAYEGIIVSGVIGKPEIARSNRKNQTFFINGRYIKDKVLYNSVDRAFKGMIPLGRFGFCILNVEMDPKLVDVNVHPSKLEVRFEKEQFVNKAVYSAVKNGFIKEELVENVLSSKFDIKNNVSEKFISENKEKYTFLSGDKKNSKKDNTEILFEDENSEKVIGSNKINLEEAINDKINSEDNESEELRQKNEQLKMKFDMYNIASRETTVDDNKINEIINKYKQKYGNPQQILEELEVEEKGVLPNSENNKNDLSDDLFSINEDINSINNEENILNQNSNKVDLNQASTLDLNIVNTMFGESKVEEENDINSNKNNIISNLKNSKFLERSIIKNQVKNDAEIEINEDGSYKIKDSKLDEIIKKDEDVNFEEINTLEKIKNINENSTTHEIANQIVEERGKFVDTDVVDTEEINRKLKEGLIDKDPTEEAINNFDQMYEKAFGVEILEKRKEKRELEKQIDGTNNLRNVNNTTMFKGNSVQYRVIGVAFRTYIIVEVNQEIYLIDQHAAHERVLFEKVKKNYYDGIRDTQTLLLPDVITLSYREFELAKNNKEIFERSGFVFEEFGMNTIKLTGVPSMVEILNTKELFLDILDEIDGSTNSGRKEIEYRFLATVACKAAVKANMNLSESDIKSLLDEMFAIKEAYTCPHGRPTMIKMSKYDIERKFSRK